ncbi:type II toxin-antitoxin system RelE/ParE family toxin [Pelagibacterium halotolerans]|uniref:type II toxin-antitoxin system RelE/ParE family toxin n=1 Tax=Pelagibacterium halotolerans TaxID=531813 RepID=UPI00384AAABE
MQDRRFLLLPRADRDLEDIWLYTCQRWARDHADMYQRELNAVFEALAAGTKRGRMVDVRSGYFKYAHRVHVVYFREREDAIEIVRILHGRMDVGRHL